MDNISEAMDACIEKLEGVVLFGKDRPIETLDQAMKRKLFSTCVYIRRIGPNRYFRYRYNR